MVPSDRPLCRTTQAWYRAPWSSMNKKMTEPMNSMNRIEDRAPRPERTPLTKVRVADWPAFTADEVASAAADGLIPALVSQAETSSSASDITLPISGAS